MTTSSSGALPLALLQRLCAAAEMRRWDAAAIAEQGIPAATLMERAASAVADRIAVLAGAGGAARPVVVCCGAGNNGGDGYAVARLLGERGLPVRVVALGRPAEGAAADNAARWAALGETLDFATSKAAAEVALEEAGTVVDALFGTGLNRPVKAVAAALIAAINASPARWKVGVDVPSGINADSGAVLGAAVTCHHTVTFQAGKIGCYQHPGAAHAGSVEVADIGIPERWEAGDSPTYLLTPLFARALLPVREAAGHKGTFGHLLAVCGSAGMGGSALLAGLAGLKSGAGLVTVGVPRCLRDGFLGAAPELMTLSPPGGSDEHFEPAHAEAMIAAAASRSAVVLGCGLGAAPETRAFVGRVVEGVAAPLLIDADGLNAMTGDQLAARTAPTVITPHPGEMVRLSGLTREELAEDRVGHARARAAAWGVVLLLKGALTVVAAPSGEVFINPTGDEGLATAGTGDVLSGLIGGLLAQGMAPLPAALLGVYLHGLARDCRKEQIAAPAFTATDLIGALSTAYQALAPSDDAEEGG